MTSTLELEEFTPAPPPEPAATRGIAPRAAQMKFEAVLGRARLEVASLLRLARGSVIDLDRKVGEPVELYVEERLAARGEIVVVDGRLGVKVTEVIGDPA